eukprot:jgi/Phyca11/19043/fgenesh1_pg.PHYCAscaffold_43_\
MTDSPGKRKSMPSPIQKMEKDAANNIWTIWYAAQYGKLERVRSLLDRNAVSSVDVQEVQGNTPLHLAAGWGDLECITLVLEGGADVRQKNNTDQTPLDVAVSLARKDHVRLLKDWKPLGLSAEGWNFKRCTLNDNVSEKGTLVFWERGLHTTFMARDTGNLRGEADLEATIALENLAIVCEQAGMVKLTEIHLKTLVRLLTERLNLQ